MTEDFLTGTRVVLPAEAAPAFTVVVDDDTFASELADAVRDLSTAPADQTDPAVDAGAVEIRAAITGPTRVQAEWVSDVVFVAQTVALGAVASGVWAGLATIWRLALARRTDPLPSHRLTVVIPGEHGETRVETVTVGPGDPEASVHAVQQIVATITGDGTARGNGP